TPFASSDNAGDGSDGAMHVFGKTVSGDPTLAWGAGFGVNLRDQTAIYDGSRYAGITFKAKVGPGASNSVRFNVGDINTHPAGNLCTACWNHFGKNMILTTEWKEYKVTFTSCARSPTGARPVPPRSSRASWSRSTGRSTPDRPTTSGSTTSRSSTANDRLHVTTCA